MRYRKNSNKFYDNVLCIEMRFINIFFIVFCANIQCVTSYDSIRWRTIDV